MDRLGLPTQELARQVAITREYFKARGEDPTVYAPDFFWYHTSQGKTPPQIWAIACNRKES